MNAETAALTARIVESVQWSYVNGWEVSFISLNTSLERDGLPAASGFLRLEVYRLLPNAPLFIPLVLSSS